jgi:hypothetical protein
MRPTVTSVVPRILRFLVVVLLCLAGAALAHGPPRRGRVLYGVTIDRVDGLGRISAVLARLPERPTVRIVFDRSEPAEHYVAAARRVARVGRVMGEILDSSDERSISARALGARASSYLHRLGRSVSIWEVGNELNGNWTGSYQRVGAKTAAALSVINRAGVPTAITLYANDFAPGHCGDGTAELTPAQFARRYLSRTARAELAYLFLSYYPTQCRGVEPTATVVAAHLRRLHRLFPHARLGFGETGLPRPATPATIHRATQIMHWAYSLDPDLPYYAGGYFWWNGYEDALGPRSPLSDELAKAFSAEHAALGG